MGFTRPITNKLNKMNYQYKMIQAKRLQQEAAEEAAARKAAKWANYQPTEAEIKANIKQADQWIAEEEKKQKELLGLDKKNKQPTFPWAQEEQVPDNLDILAYKVMKNYYMQQLANLQAKTTPTKQAPVTKQNNSQSVFFHPFAQFEA